MKKMYFVWAALISMTAALLFPSPVGATMDAYYDLGGGNVFVLAALVCNIDDCVSNGEPADWKNYSDYSANPEMTSGNGDTLTVSPGDTLTFLGLVHAEGDVNITPVFGISFTGESYIEEIDPFSSGSDDLDGDTNVFVYAAADNITLSSGLSDAMDTEVGSISAKVKSDVPDGTVITGTFYVIDPDVERIGGFFGIEKAYAEGEDTYLSSTVRMIVSNPTAAAEVVTLPQTGTETPTPQNTVLVLSVLALLAVSVPVGNVLVKKYLKK